MEEEILRKIRKCGLETLKLINSINFFKEILRVKEKVDKDEFEILHRKLENRLIEFEHACRVDVDDIIADEMSDLYNKHRRPLIATLILGKIEDKIREKLKVD